MALLIQTDQTEDPPLNIMMTILSYTQTAASMKDPGIQRGENNFGLVVGLWTASNSTPIYDTPCRAVMDKMCINCVEIYWSFTGSK